MVDSNPSVEAWTENTNPFERVWSVTKTVSEPQSAQWIAAEAAVSESATRTHLEQLVEMNAVLEYTDSDTVTYAPDPIYHRFQVVRDLLDEHDQDGLRNLKEDLHAQIEMSRDKYEVGSPEELCKLATRTDSTEQTAAIHRTATEWEVIEYRLGVIKQVLSNYDTYKNR